jgi:hypothetical protein
MSQRDIVALACALIFLALIALAVSAIKRRAIQQSGLGALTALETVSGATTDEASGFYVSTVFADKPLERIVSHGLLHRGKVDLVLRSDGIQVKRLGEASFAIAASAITDVARATATIDRGVEQSGLLAISWMLGETEVTTNFRLDAADDTQTFFEKLSQFKRIGAGK